MRHLYPTLAVLSVLFVVLSGGCSSGEGEEHGSGHLRTERGEHDREGGEHGRARGGHEEEGEESGIRIVRNGTYDRVRRGARLVLAYDPQAAAFKGTVKNTTAGTLKRVRVEVHLSGGRELGPTAPADLAAGESRDIVLKAESTDFEWWTAHPEVGSGEHGGEHGGERGRREGRGEHRGEHGGERGREHRGEHR